MKAGIKLGLILILIVTLCGCEKILNQDIIDKVIPAPEPEMDIEKVQRTTFEETPLYEPPELPEKPEKPSFICLDAEYRITDDESRAAYVAVTTEDAKKITALNVAYNSQKSILVEQTELIILSVDEINQLKELINLKEDEVEKYIELYQNAEKARVKAERMRKIEAVLSRVQSIAIVGGVIALLVLAP